MKISKREWDRYKNKMSALSQKATDELQAWITRNGGLAMVDRDALIRYTYALTKKYGEGAASLSAIMYDSIAEKSGVAVPGAVVAETATYGEVAKTVNGILKVSENEDLMSSVAGRLVKQAGADTTLKNAKRDRAEFAWISVGDSCPFCLMLASNGWQPASKAVVDGNHADHIHANCDCEFVIRFNSDTEVEGYNPDAIKAEFKEMDGRTWNDKVNSMRRIQYQENKEEINEQHREAYEARKEEE